MKREQLVERVLHTESDYVIERLGELENQDIRILRNELIEKGFYIANIQIQERDDYKSFLIDQIDVEFAFPYYFGFNWDAVDECITDLNWLRSDKYCTLCTNAILIKENDLRVYELFKDIFKWAGETWKEKDVLFKLVCL